MAVEFALVLMFFLLILFGGISLSFMILDQAIISNASREAARWQVAVENNRESPVTSATQTCLTQTATTKSAIDVACNYLHANLVSFGASNSIATVTSSSTVPRYVTVKITYPFISLPSPLLSFGTDPISISAATVMYYE